MLTTFQLRAARGGLRVSVQDLADIIGVQRRTIHRIETCDTLSLPVTSARTLFKLQAYFEEQGVIFSDDGQSIHYRPPPTYEAGE
jgi:DNA-binding XRE family transcriptional regulator